MAAEPLALSTVPPPAETEYDAICSAVTATARGRWFLDEYARRNRNSDTLQVLAAIARMEAAVVGDRAQQASQEANQQVHIELLEMARVIAQTRAELAERLPQRLADQQLSAEPAGADVAAAAERLRQIAWAMRACGVELAASDQVGQIAETILSADALRSLSDQRAHKLTEVLHYLEHRIDRMLDSHLAAAAPQANGHDYEAVLAAMTRAAALADVAPAVEAEAKTESAPSFAAEDTVAPAAATAPDATEIPMGDDVVLTVTDRAVESEPSPAPPAASALEPEPTAAAASVEPEATLPATFEAQGLRSSLRSSHWSLRSSRPRQRPMNRTL
jgi:hypothetical protein